MQVNSTDAVLNSLETAAGSPLVSGVIVLSISTVLFCIFLVGAVGLGYLAIRAWANYERPKTQTIDKSQQSSYDRERSSGFDENALLVLLVAELTVFWNALGAFLATALGTARGVGEFILQNFVVIIGFLATFALVIMWDTYHNVLLQAFAETYNCFLAPVLRTLVLPIINIITLILGAIIPLINAVRQILVSVTTLAFFRALACAGETTLVIIEQASVVLSTFTLALVTWLQLGSVGQSALVIAPDFYAAGNETGILIAGLQTYADCLCEPLSKVALTPLFEPFEDPAFAQTFNQTTNILFVPVTQGFLRPIVESFLNAEATPGAPFIDIFSRPSFNSTFDVLSGAAVGVGRVLDLYVIAVYKIFANVVSTIISTCPQTVGWDISAGCNNDPGLIGNCFANECNTVFVLPTGCCKRGGDFCTMNDTVNTCPSALFSPNVGCAELGSQCSNVTPFGCCTTNETTAGSVRTADLCAENVIMTDCTAPNSLFYMQATCSSITSLRCNARTSGFATLTTEKSCGSCTDNGVPCFCTDCRCEYQAETQLLFALDSCPSIASEATCDVALGGLPEPFRDSFFTGAIQLGIDSLIIQPLRYIWNIIWNLDIIFTTFDGYLFFDIENIVQSVKTGTVSITRLIDWFARWLEELGDLAAASLSTPPSSSLAIQYASGITAQQLQVLDDTLSVEGDLLNEALDIVAKIIRVPRNFIIATVNFFAELIQLLVNLPFGTAWLTADTAINQGVPLVLEYAQILWGDMIRPGTVFGCNVRTASFPDGRALFTVRTVDPTESPCNEEIAALNYCRYVVQQAVAPDFITNANQSAALAFVPNGMELVVVFPFLRNNVIECFATQSICSPTVVPQGPGAATAVPENQFETILRRGVAILTSLDPLISIFCGGCDELDGFFTGLAEPFVPILLPLIDFLTHVDKVFSSSYIKCLDLISAFDGVNAFVFNITRLFRAVNTAIFNTPCATGNAARDSRILCVIAQAIDSFVLIFTELAKIIWNVVQVIIGLLDQSITDTSVLTDLITITPLEINVRNLAFDFVAVLLQIIPFNVNCVQSGCCQRVTLPLVFPEVAECSYTTLSGCQDTDPTTAIFFSAGVTCFDVPMDDVTCVPPITGCCKTVDITNLATGTTARICREQVTSADCQGSNQIFYFGVSCNDSPGPFTCPPSVVAQSVISDALSSIGGDIVLAIPRILVGVVRAFVLIVETFTMPSAAPYIELINAIFTPLFEALSNVFDQIARIFACAGEGAIADAFFTVGAVIREILDVGLKILGDLVLLVFYVVFGIIEVVTTFTFRLLTLAVELLLQLILFFAFAIFGADFVCGVQGFVCELALGNNDAVSFAVDQCRTYYCCTQRPDPDPVTCGPFCSIPFPSDGMPACCCQTTGAITSCADPRVKCPNMPARKRNEVIINPFIEFIAKELQQASEPKRKRTEVAPPLAEFCGAYLATYGFEKATAERATNPESMASQCLAVSVQKTSGSIKEEVDLYFSTKLAQYGAQWARMRASVATHWHEMRVESHEEAMHRIAVSRGDKQAIALSKTRAKYGLYDLLKSVRNFDAPHLHKRSAAEQRMFHEHTTEIMKTHGHVLARNLIINVMTAVVHVHKTWVSPFQNWPTKRTPALDASAQKRSVMPNSQPMTKSKRLQLGLRVGVYYFNDMTTRLSAAMGKTIGRAIAGLPRTKAVLPKASPVASTQRTFATPLFINNDTLGLINLPECNVTVQGVCTGCAILDDGIFAVQDAGNGLVEFYPNNETGFISYVNRFNEGIDNTLTNPRGNDMFTTMPKRVPWIAERFLTVQWFWQWNYTQFLDIVRANQTSTETDQYVNQTVILQQERAAALDRTDFDNTVLDLFAPVLTPVLNALERVVGSAVSVRAADVLSELYTTYIECDYQGALQCQSADLGIGLFDAWANVALIYIIIGTVLVSINVIFGVSIFALLLPVAYFLIVWIAYGASPLCTLPSFIGGIPGIATCLPADLYTLASESLQQCPVVPIALIAPGSLAEASTTLCTTCGAVPEITNCAEFGFLNGLDVIFYSAPAIFGDEFNADIAALIAPVAPGIADVAAIYTPEKIAALGAAGADCNRITFPSLLTATVAIALFLAAIGTLLLFLALFAAAAFWLYWITLVLVNEFIRQIDEGFVQNTKVQKLKVKSD